MQQEHKEAYGLFVLWAVTIVVLILGTWNAFGWSVRALDLRWCSESIINKNGECDAPARVVRSGEDFVCRCP